jgi:predicted O-linked N-acetylglucosamine transferase (SPINDLY family)
MSRKHRNKKGSSEKRSYDIKELFETAYSFHVKGDYAKAEEYYTRIIRMEPRHSNALNLLGTIFLERGAYDRALDLIRKAVKAYPMGAMFHNNLGNVFREMGLVKDAEKAYREALRVDPACVSANNNLGTVLHELGDMDGAIDCFERAHRKDPGFSPAYYNLGRVFCEQGRIDTSIWAYREALKINPDFHEACSNLLYTLHFSDQETPEHIFSEHRAWAETFAKPHYPLNPVYDNTREPSRRLRIGYVSPDFRTHSVAFFLEDVFAHCNREKIEVVCYSNTEKQDQFTQRFKELADVWRDITVISDDEAARIIREDRIDILVDLAGHTRNSRILIFARKPAPIQVTWLGYPDTTGLETMDYRLTDAIADPPGVSDHLATEKLIRLDGGFLCYRPSGESYPISPSPALASGAVTFGSFNNNSKISERVISVWSKILKKTPGSRLKLKSRSFADFGTRKHILERFDHYGIPSDRIWF